MSLHPRLPDDVETKHAEAADGLVCTLSAREVAREQTGAERMLRREADHRLRRVRFAFVEDLPLRWFAEVVRDALCEAGERLPDVIRRDAGRERAV